MEVNFCLKTYWIGTVVVLTGGSLSIPHRLPGHSTLHSVLIPPSFSGLKLPMSRQPCAIFKLPNVKAYNSEWPILKEKLNNF